MCDGEAPKDVAALVLTVVARDGHVAVLGSGVQLRPVLVALAPEPLIIILIKFIQDMYSTKVHKCNTRTKFLNLTRH